MTESKLYKRLKRSLPDAHWVRLENSISSGVPDLHVTYEGKSLWLELKVLHNSSINIRPLQIVWARKEYRAGRAVFFVWEWDNKLCGVSTKTIIDLKAMSEHSNAIRYVVKSQEDFILDFGDLHHLFLMV